MKKNEQNIEHTFIEQLGETKINSKLNVTFVSEQKVPFFLDSEQGDLFEGGKSMTFESAGPREKLYFDPSKTKCAIVTCGGLCPGINDVIRSIVMQAFHIYNMPAVLGIKYGLEGFIPKYNHSIEELNPRKVSNIHTFGGTILGTSRGPQDPVQIVDALERMNVNILFTIGGDGTLKASSAIAKEIKKRNLHISVIGIPKTIDNDIHLVPQSFGFETAVDRATDAISCAHTEAQGAFNGIGLVKLMGRESGFIAAQATLSLSEVNYVLIPETPFELEGEGGLLQSLEDRLKTRSHAVIVVAEGAGQHLMAKSEGHDASGNPVLGDIAGYLQQKIKEHFKAQGIQITLKYIDPSYMIRSIPANAGDRVYCSFLGQHAVHAAMAGKTNMVVAKLLDRYVHIPLDLVTTHRRRLNTHSGLWRATLATTGQGHLKGMLS